MRDSNNKLTPGHTGSKTGREINCKLFGEKFPISHASERESRLKDARKVKRNALLKIARLAKASSNESN